MKKILTVLTMMLLATGCSTTAIMESLEGEKIELLKFDKTSQIVIYYHTTGYISYSSYGAGGGWHYGTTKPEDIHKNLKKALEWDKELGKTTKKIKKEIDSYFSGITITYHRLDSYEPSVLLCYRDAQYSSISKLDCGWISGKKKIEEFIEKTSPESIKKKEEEIKKQSELKKRLK